MNCCDDYGQCKQAHNCPARESRLEEPITTPEQFEDVMYNLVVAVVVFATVALATSALLLAFRWLGEHA